MAVDPELLELMPDVVTLLKKTSYNRFGEPILAATLTARAQVRQAPQITRNADGQEVMSRTTVILDDSYDLTPEDKIQLPGQSAAEANPVISVTRHQDQHGNHHETVRIV